MNHSSTTNEPRSTDVRPASAALDVIRLARGLSWSALARKAGLANGTRRRLRRGDPVRISTLARVAEVLGVSPGAIILAERRQRPSK